MAGTSESAKKGAITKRERNFDFAAAGRAGGKSTGKKGLAALKEKDPEKFKEIVAKAHKARRTKKL